MNQNSHQKNCTFLIVGGGIAGMSCAEAINVLAPKFKIIIITESSLIKSVTNLVQLGKYVQRFDVKEVSVGNYSNGNIEVITDQLKFVNTRNTTVQTISGLCIKYQKLCICTGARPKLIQHAVDEFVLGIRDTDSVKEFQSRIKNGRKFVLVGNGGIATEIAYEIKNIEIDWIVKDSHISSTFIDAGAAKFFESRLHNKEVSKEETIIKRLRYEESSTSSMHKGAALGPDWHRLIDMTGTSTNNPDNIHIHYGVEVKNVTINQQGDNFPVSVELTNGTVLSCDFIISATGVNPNINFECDEELKLESDSGILVDELMKTSIDSVYAAGDCCSAGWQHSRYWFQMKLWTQARQMGMMAGKSMVADLSKDQIYQDFCFEIFSHVTKLYGYQVVLLGKFNGQGLDGDCELLLRITPDKEYVKFVLKNGKLIGALLIGDTGLEETCENLILNEIDLTPYGDDILNPLIDIEDYFD